MKEERTWYEYTYLLSGSLRRNIDYKAIANTLFLNIPAINNYVSCVGRDVALKIYQRLELYSSYNIGHAQYAYGTYLLSRTSVLFLIFGLNIDFVKNTRGSARMRNFFLLLHV